MPESEGRRRQDKEEHFSGLCDRQKNLFSETVKEYVDCCSNGGIQGKTKWMPPLKYREASICLA